MFAVLAPSRTSDAELYNFIFATKDGFLISKRDISKHISKHISKTIKKQNQTTNLPQSSYYLNRLVCYSRTRGAKCTPAAETLSTATLH